MQRSTAIGITSRRKPTSPCQKCGLCFEQLDTFVLIAKQDSKRSSLRLCFLCESCGELLVGSGKVRPLNSPASEAIAKELKPKLKQTKLEPLGSKRKEKPKTKTRTLPPPQKGRGVNNRLLQMWVNPVQYALLIEEARNQDRDLSNLLRHIINKYLGIGSIEIKENVDPSQDQSEEEVTNEHDTSQQSDNTEET